MPFGKRKCEQTPTEKAEQKAESCRVKLGDIVSTSLGLKGLMPLQASRSTQNCVVLWFWNDPLKK